MKHEYVCRMCGQTPNASDCPGSGDIGMFDLPPVARSSDPDTSHAAARSLKSRRSDMARLLRQYETRACTDEEAAVLCGMGTDNGNHTKRCSDLRNAGWIAPLVMNGEQVTRMASSGRHQRVCEITEAGRRELRSL